MREEIYSKIEDAMAQAIATLAIEAIETGVILISRKLKALREEQTDGDSEESPRVDQPGLVQMMPAGKAMHFDDLLFHSGKQAGPLAAELLQLEMQGYIRRLSGDLYARAS